MVRAATNIPPGTGTGSGSIGDALGEVVRRLGMGSATSLLTELGGPWGIHFPTSSALFGFHYLCEGAAWVLPAGAVGPEGREGREGRDRPAGLWMAAGDLVMFPSGSGHVIADAPTSPSVPYFKVPRLSGTRTHTLLCGAYKLGGSGVVLSPDDPVMAMLPRMVHLRAAQIAATPGLLEVLAALRQEAASQRPGRDAVISSLVGVVLAYVVRGYLSALASEHAEAGGAGEAPAERRGEGGELRWMSAPRDPRMTRTLAAIHVSPGERWTVEKLAEIARMSRASFARRFAQLVGDTPLAYVAARRLDLAARLLRESEQQLGEIAAAVGYESEFALSRAFKRSRDVAPGRYRALHRAGLLELR